MAITFQSRDLVFKQSTTRSDILDQTGSQFNGFSFIRLSEPHSIFLIKQGEKFVVESWDLGLNTLFTGLQQFRVAFALMIVTMDPCQLIINLFSTYSERTFKSCQ